MNLFCNCSTLCQGVELWIEGYSNSGTKIKTHAIKKNLRYFQKEYPNKNYQLLQCHGLWFIAKVA